MRKKDIIILAAGVGSRLRPLTDEQPKTMVRVNGTSIIERLLRQLISFENTISTVYILTGYKQEVLKEFVDTLNLPYDIEFIENKDYASTNNMYSLYLALKRITSDAIITVNADCVYDDQVIEQMLLSKDNCISIDCSVYMEESMKVQLSNKVPQKVIGMSKQLQESPDVFVSMDIYNFQDAALIELRQIVERIILSGDMNSWTEVAVDQLVQAGTQDIWTLDMTGLKWMEIDNHEDLKTANIIFADK